MQNTFSKEKIQGVGLGLRFQHFDNILEGQLHTPWFEVIADDYLNPGPHFEKLERLRAQVPIAFHSIGMNVGGVDDFDMNYLSRLKRIYEQFEPSWISDHLCWSMCDGYYHHDLLPTPRTKESLHNICQRIDFIQNFFKRKLVIENITSYIEFKENDCSEPEFINSIIEQTGCELLLDISNVLINSKNKTRSTSNEANTWVSEWISAIPLEKVRQIHLAGGESNGEIIIDTHSSTVNSADILLYKEIVQQGFHIPAIIERDANIPPFEVLEKERTQLEKEVYEI